jgi:hypothetical protein
MKPEWFGFDEIPYSEMWPDDEYWLPKVLEGKKIVGSFFFDAPASLNHQAAILSHEVSEVSDFNINITN